MKERHRAEGRDGVAMEKFSGLEDWQHCRFSLLVQPWHRGQEKDPRIKDLSGKIVKVDMSKP